MSSYNSAPELHPEDPPPLSIESLSDPLRTMPALTKYSLDSRTSYFQPVQNIPFARDTSVSLLSLSIKLRRAQQLYNQAGRVSDLTLEASTREEIGDEAAMIVDLAKLKHFQRISPLRNFYAPEACHAQLSNVLTNIIQPRPKIIPACIKVVKIDKPLPKIVPVKKPTFSGTSSEEDIVGFTINPFKIEKPPVEALQLLASIKQRRNEIYSDLPQTTGLPIWPVLSATKESGPKVDFSYLSQFIHFDDEQKTTTAADSDKRDAAGDASRVVREEAGEKVECSESSEGDVAKSGEEGEVKTPEKSTTINAKLINIDPTTLTPKEEAAVDELAYDSISSVYIQRTARKALDLTRYALYETRKRSLASITPIRAKKAKESDVTTASPGAVSLLTPGNSSSLLLQQLAQKVSPRRGRPPGSTKSQLTSAPKSSATAAANAAAAAAVLSATASTAAACVSTSGANASKKSLSAVPPNVIVNGSGEIKTQNQIKSHRPYGKARESWVPRRYKCTQCTYQTDNRSHLRRHESSVHSGAKMYQCYVCKLEFARSEKCRMHLSKVHPDFEYDPRLIRKDRPFSFTSAAAVAAHMTTSENSESQPPAAAATDQTKAAAAAAVEVNASNETKDDVDSGECSFTTRYGTSCILLVCDVHFVLIKFQMTVQLCKS